MVIDILPELPIQTGLLYAAWHHETHDLISVAMDALETAVSESRRNFVQSNWWIRVYN